MKRSDSQLLPIALILVVLVHGIALPFTFEGTYDAYVHMFFADHYAGGWFETWEPRWYTGFTVTSYPPLVHQVIALISKVLSLKFGFMIWSILMSLWFVRGVYVFSKIWVSPETAGYAAILAVFATSFVQALHIFGQLPSITGIAFLLNACYELYRWLRYGERWRFLSAVALMAITSSAHHVTTIFGTVFFILPVMWGALYKRTEDQMEEGEELTFATFIKHAIPQIPKLAAFGFIIIILTAIVIFPYWFWSKTDPIAQVPIPHGSRDSYVEILSSGLMFFIIPWGILLFVLPFIVRSVYRKPNLALGLSITLLFILGTGGTTPIPRKILGETAFEILTLDRFTFWATILSIPFAASFTRSLLSQTQRSVALRVLSILLGTGVIVSAALTINFQRLIKIQPRKIDVEPIVNFLASDQHHEWRYLTLGFGDQMAWLSANTDALSVDGNYHSARRLPEMTSRAVERLENAKYLGSEGLNSLRDFLSTPEKYRLKYVFSNDQFYDPALFFYGWNRIVLLENDIVVWERPDVPKLPAKLSLQSIPTYQRVMWGVIPISGLILGLFAFVIVNLHYREKPDGVQLAASNSKQIGSIDVIWVGALSVTILAFVIYRYATDTPRTNPETLVETYYDHLDFKRFGEAHALLDPESRPSFEKFTTENSLDGGILASYAKLQSIEITKDTSQGDGVHMLVTSHWLTALQEYTVTKAHRAVHKGLFWHLVHPEPQTFIPPDQYLRAGEVSLYNQGQRDREAAGTSKRDVLDRPKIQITESNLIACDEGLFVVGQLLNVDTDPAFVTVEVVLYDDTAREIARGTARDLIKHVLYPKESTPFRIDFDQLDNMDSLISRNLDFVVFARSVVAESEGYRHIGSHWETDNSDLIVSGELVNYGPQQMLIPQVLVAVFNERGIIGLHSDYLSNGIRPQRSAPFIIPIHPQDHRVIQSGSREQFVVNGEVRASIPDQQSSSSSRSASAREVIIGDSTYHIKVYSQAMPYSIYDVN